MKNSIVTFLILIMVTLGGVAFATGMNIKEICTQLIESSEGKSAVEGAEGWLFFKEELEHIAAGKFWGEEAEKVSKSRKKEFADPVPAIVSYNKALAEKGVTLYLVPVPPKGLVYAENLMDGVEPEGVGAERGLYSQFYKTLEEQGVKVIDMLPGLVEKSKTEQMYCKTDTHFSGNGLELFADAIAEVIKKEPWYGSIAQREFSVKEQAVSISGDLSRMLGKDDKEELALSLVSDKSTGALVESDEQSPVILLGDSHTLVFSAGGDLHAKGGGLFDNLSAKLGFPIDLLGVRGSGVTPARIKLFQRSKKNPDYLKGKKALIWCFTAREFTGTGGWREIPVSSDK